MSAIKDCGDVTVTVVIRTGVKFALAAVGDEMSERIVMADKVADILPRLEKTILEQICDHIGYDAETCEAKLKAREEKNIADRKAEDEGRAEKQAERDGLPPLQPHPPPVAGLGETAPEEPAAE